MYIIICITYILCMCLASPSPLCPTLSLPSRISARTSQISLHTQTHIHTTHTHTQIHIHIHTYVCTYLLYTHTERRAQATAPVRQRVRMRAAGRDTGARKARGTGGAGHRLLQRTLLAQSHVDELELFNKARVGLGSRVAASDELNRVLEG